MKRALITGIEGQDGPYLAEHLLSKGHEVWGTVLSEVEAENPRITALLSDSRFHLVTADLRDARSVRAAVHAARPDKVFNLAAQSGVGISFSIPEETLDINFWGFERLVDAALSENPQVRIYQASTSEMFGTTPAPQHEESPFQPVSPYGISKLRAHTELVLPYRRKNVFICSGILFNHESPYRGEGFVTRKITRGLAAIALQKQKELLLGNLDVRRDWGFAGDYVRAMDLMLEQEVPDDFVIATGVSHSIRDFVDAAASALSTPITWQGTGLEEVGMSPSGEVIIRINPDFYRPAEILETRGDARKATRTLGWTPKVSFAELVRMMVEADKKRLSP